MDPRSSPPMLLAPGAAAHALSAPARAPAARQPAIDDNLLAENCGYEIVGGQIYELAPAEEEHGTEHFVLPGVLKSCLAPEYKGTVDMLSRPEASANHAPDVSILPRARDAATGGRQIEDLIFEVIDTESRAHVATKTRTLIGRGVRRAFLLDVNARSLAEWSREADDWVALAEDAVLEDRCFAVPIPVRALVDDVLADDVVAQALLRRGNRVLAAEIQGARAEGEVTSARASLLRVLTRRRLTLTDAQRERVRACADLPTLEAWLDRAVDAETTDDVFG